jgi:hypothetical protein
LPIQDPIGLRLEIDQGFVSNSLPEVSRCVQPLKNS